MNVKTRKEAVAETATREPEKNEQSELTGRDGGKGEDPLPRASDRV